MAEQIEDFKTFSQVTDARWYPRYHIAPPFGWCNDPNGMCYYKGQYHFFYQHYPYEPRWGPMHWGHVVSDDLAYWKPFIEKCGYKIEEKFLQSGCEDVQNTEWYKRQKILYECRLPYKAD